jgi:hypothetical protein
VAHDLFGEPRPLRRIMRYQIPASAPLFPKFVREGAAMNHEFRKRALAKTPIG